jgi:hypothetical protein
MKYIHIFIFLFYWVHAQNPYDFIGQQHNLLLKTLIECENAQDYLCLNPIVKYDFNNYLTYGDAEILAFLDYANLTAQEKQTIFEFVNFPDELPLETIEILLDSLEKDAIQKKTSPIFLGFWSVAKHSLQFWKHHKWKDEKKPPLMAIVKADALGLLKGIVIGAVFWIGSNFIFDVPDAIGIVGGSTIAVGFTALDSFRISKKYKKRAEI